MINLIVENIDRKKEIKNYLKFKDEQILFLDIFKVLKIISYCEKNKIEIEIDQDQLNSTNESNTKIDHVILKHNNFQFLVYKNLFKSFNLQKDKINNLSNQNFNINPNNNLDLSFDRNKEKLNKNFLTKLLDPENKFISLILHNAGDFAIGIQDENECVFHKTSHAYVIRKKSGKSQASKDKVAGSNIKSTGSQLRRENEVHLKEKIQDCIENAKEQFDKSIVILLQCTGAENLNMWINKDDGLLKDYLTRIKKVSASIHKSKFEQVEQIFKKIRFVKVQMNKEDLDTIFK